MRVDPDLSAVLLDSTVGRARVRAPKQAADPARGRNRGGFSTQIRLLMDRQGRPLSLRVTGGPRHDHTQVWARFAA